jgi:hypothetical protein
MRARFAKYIGAFGITILLVFYFPGSNTGSAGPRAKLVSMINLIAEPDAYHDLPVIARGVLSTGFESTAIYLSQSDAEHAVTKNAVWLDLPDKNLFQHLDGQYVLVEGVFDKNNLGHLKLYSGSIGSIRRIAK